jgi:hypothetical protein
MTTAIASPEQQSAAPSFEAAQEDLKSEITRVATDYFHWREFRYTSLKDAVAQAKRAQANQSLNKSSSISPEPNDEMMTYGISRVPVDNFCYREFRYTNLNDAVTQAKRQRLSI